jgi:hypothetical protein
LVHTKISFDKQKQRLDFSLSVIISLFDSFVLSRIPPVFFALTLRQKPAQHEAVTVTQLSTAANNKLFSSIQARPNNPMLALE